MYISKQLALNNYYYVKSLPGKNVIFDRYNRETAWSQREGVIGQSRCQVLGVIEQR